MISKPLLSLCIPTNGIIKWVKPVLLSIYEGIDDYREFEVVVTDNGVDESFENAMREFSRTHNNFRYYKTNAYMFLNQIEAFKQARGEFIRFVNHRATLLPGSVNYLITYVKNNIESKPVTYFLNGKLGLPEESRYDSFNKYVGALSYWSSWSAGTAIWKKDFEKLDLSIKFNKLFPHTDLLFSNKTANEYSIVNKPLVSELPDDSMKKGNYDVFEAFAVEYPSIINKLLEDESITKDTYEKIIKDNGKFVKQLYYDYVVRKHPCSYDLGGFDRSVGIYYKKNEIGFGIEDWIKLILKKMKQVLTVN